MCISKLCCSSFFQDADVGMGFFSVIEERMKVVNFSTYLGCDTYTLLMKNAPSLSKVEAITAPFTPTVGNINHKQTSTNC